MSVYIPSDLFKPLGELLEKCIFALRMYGYIEGCDTPRSHPEHECNWIRLKVATGIYKDGDAIAKKLGEIGIYVCRHGMKRPWFENDFHIGIQEPTVLVLYDILHLKVRR
jgi:hypothetical protein